MFQSIDDQGENDDNLADEVNQEKNREQFKNVG